MPDDAPLDFQAELRRIVDLPGLTNKKVGEWAGVDGSRITRWLDGETPRDPVAILQRLRPHVERTQGEIASLHPTQVDSWKSLIADLTPGLREHVEQTGLLASAYHVIITWLPSTSDPAQLDCCVARYFHGCWADMSHPVYNIGDQSQTVSFGSSDGAPGFDQARALGDLVDIEIKVDKEVGKSVASLHVRLGLEEMPFRKDTIGFIDGFGYRFRATKAIVRHRPPDSVQTNDFLGAPLVLACRNFQLIVCIPKTCYRGSPFALSSSNRSMLKLLMEYDNTAAEKIEAMLWPRGRVYELKAGPDSPLKVVSRVGAMLDSALPHRLLEAIKEPKEPADLDDPTGESIRDVLCRDDSACFMLELHNPHPSLTHNIVWRLRDPRTNGSAQEST